MGWFARTFVGSVPAVLLSCSFLVDTSGMSGGQVAPITSADAGLDALVGEAGADADEGGAPLGPVSLAAGGESTCASRGASLWCWGKNDRGQIGDGSKLSRVTPSRVLGLPAGEVGPVGVGQTHACAVVLGDVWCWGSGTSGELGDGKKADSSVPVKVTGLPSGKGTDACAGTNFSCAVADTVAYCWGTNSAGQLGIGVSGTVTSVPAAVSTGAGSLTGVAGVSCGQDHACARTSKGEVLCWGHNDNGALGNATIVVNESSPKAIAVQGLSGAADAMEMAGWHGCVIIGGAMSCWGTGTSGELGNGVNANSTAPVPVTGLGSGVTSFGVGGGPDDGDATCAVKDKQVFCWGNGATGRIGDGNTANRSIPLLVANLPPNATHTAGGFFHFCAAFEGGEVRCWGRGTAGQIGDGAGVDRFTPVAVTVPR